MTIEVSFIHSYCLNGQGGPPQLVVALVYIFFTYNNNNLYKKLYTVCIQFTEYKLANLLFLL